MLDEESCCHGDASLFDTILTTIRYKRRSMLKKLLSAEPKGASRLAGSTVYVVRLGRDGSRRMARPCDSCWEKLRGHGVKFVIYTTDGGWEKERL